MFNSFKQMVYCLQNDDYLCEWIFAGLKRLKSKDKFFFRCIYDIRINIK